MEITLRDILEHLYEAAYWDGEKGRHDRMEPAVEQAEELIGSQSDLPQAYQDEEDVE